MRLDAPTAKLIQFALDSIAVSVFANIFIELRNTVSDGKIQITILILRRGALSILSNIILHLADSGQLSLSSSYSH